MGREKAGKPRQAKLRSSVRIGLNASYRATVSEVATLHSVSGLADIEFPTGLPAGEALALVQSERLDVTMHEWMLYGAVASARDAGCSWAAIGEVLGVTRQSAQAKYGPVVDNGRDDDD